MPDNLKVSAQYSLDGKSTANVAGYSLTEDVTSPLQEYGFAVTAKNVNIVIEGSFKLNTILTRYATAGRR